MSNLTIQQALDDIRTAEDALAEALKTNCPTGTRVTWESGSGAEYGGGVQHGQVIFATSNRVRVRNDRTGAEYFIHAYRLTARYGGEIHPQ